MPATMNNKAASLFLAALAASHTASATKRSPQDSSSNTVDDVMEAMKLLPRSDDTAVQARQEDGGAADEEAQCDEELSSLLEDAPTPEAELSEWAADASITDGCSLTVPLSLETQFLDYVSEAFVWGMGDLDKAQAWLEACGDEGGEEELNANQELLGEGCSTGPPAVTFSETTAGDVFSVLQLERFFSQIAEGDAGVSGSAGSPPSASASVTDDGGAAPSETGAADEDEEEEEVDDDEDEEDVEGDPSGGLDVSDVSESVAVPTESYWDGGDSEEDDSAGDEEDSAADGEDSDGGEEDSADAGGEDSADTGADGEEEDGGADAGAAGEGEDGEDDQTAGAVGLQTPALGFALAAGLVGVLAL